jgi:glycosyltransferase involved in cell wall biosynthesis
VLIRAFLRTFSPRDDVLLVLKVSNSDPRFDVRRHLAELTGTGATPPIVVMLNQAVDAHQMSVLYRSADCFVLPTRGEGWGMPAVEAMACGLPVITTDWGAQTAFLRPEISYPLRVRGLVPAVARAPYYAGLHWAEPDGDQLCDLMRYVYENQQEARERGARAAADVHDRWTWRHTVDAILARLEAL